MDKPRVYSPEQIGWGSLLGGPIVAVDLLRANFIALGAIEAARKTLYLGILFNLGLIAIPPVLPKGFPAAVIPAVYSFVASNIASTRQMTKQTITSSDAVDGRPNGPLVVRVIVLMVATVVLWLAVYLGLDVLGVPVFPND